MAEISGPNLTVIGIFATISFAFLIYHTYKFDGCRCLIPRRKEWFRCLLTYMLLVSNTCWIIWAVAWGFVKYSLGFVRLGPAGARPWPSALFPATFVKFNPPLTVLLGICYGLQASLNAEEGLFWFHLIASVSAKRSRTPVPFLQSYYFKAWILVSICIAVIQLGTPWIGHDGDLRIQLAKELLSGGVLEFIVLIASTTVVLKFPKFLRDLETAGAGPEVRSRLQFFGEANKIRTFFRFTFTIPLLIFGVDGLTPASSINMDSLATDFLAAVSSGSLAIVMIISIILYLPRTSPNAARSKVMVGNLPNPNHHATDFAVLTLLREGGQWDGVDEDLVGPDGRSEADDAPFALANARRLSWNVGSEEKWSGRGRSQEIPHLLSTFTSPIAVNTEPAPHRPIEVRIHVERDVHAD